MTYLIPLPEGEGDRREAVVERELPYNYRSRSRILPLHQLRWSPSPSGRGFGEAGFTLIEVMISLGLFGLIAVAGLALVSGIINVQGRTDVRLERLAQVQRAMFVISSDIDQIGPGRILGGQNELSFTRTAPGAGGPPLPVHYSVTGGALVRIVGPQPQLMLPGASNVRWRFWDDGWVDNWPRDQANPDRWPRAIEVQMQIASPGGPAGTLRRVVTLPAQDPVPKPAPVEGTP